MTVRHFIYKNSISMISKGIYNCTFNCTETFDTIQYKIAEYEIEKSR